MFSSSGRVCLCPTAENGRLRQSHFAPAYDVVTFSPRGHVIGSSPAPRLRSVLSLFVLSPLGFVCLFVFAQPRDLP